MSIMATCVHDSWVVGAERDSSVFDRRLMNGKSVHVGTKSDGGLVAGAYGGNDAGCGNGIRVWNVQVVESFSEVCAGIVFLEMDHSGFSL